MGADAELKITESAKNRLLTYSSLPITGALAIAGVSSGRNSIGVVLAVLVFVVTATIVLFDVSYQVSFSAAGVERRCLLRRQLLRWDAITAFERSPRLATGGRIAGLLTGERNRKIGRGVGLVARVGPRRRYLLVYATERPDQWEELRILVGRYAAGTSLPSRPKADR